MDHLFKDLRYAIRSLLRQPGFAAITVLTLALGIGANTAIFSVVYSVLIKPLPFHRPDRIVLLWGDDRAENDSRSQVSHTDIVDYKAQQTLFASISTFNSWTPLISGAGEPARISGALVGDDFFQVMGTQPLLGRSFLPEEQQDGKDQVVVLSYELWQQQLNGDPNAVGKTILLNLRPHTIVGVMPASFHSLPGTLLARPALLYRPAAEETSDKQRSARHLRAVGRLKDRVTLPQAQAELNIIAQRLEAQYPESNTNWGIHLVGLREDTVRDLQKTLWVFGAGFDSSGFEVEHQPAPPGHEPMADRYIMTPGYLQALGIRLERGRELTEQETEGAPLVMLVGESLATRFWPNQDPVGKRIKLPWNPGREDEPWRTVVGVVGDVKQYGPDKPSAMAFYLPHAQYAVSFMSLVARTSGDPAEMIPAVRKTVQGLDPEQVPANVATMEDVMVDSIQSRRFPMFVLAGFAALALALSAVGIYGVMSYVVVQRTHEIGIRMALGARTSNVLRLVVGNALSLATAGILLGAVGAFALTRLMKSLLFGVVPTDVSTFVVVCVSLFVVALVACYLPARRAARIEPLVALRND